MEIDELKAFLDDPQVIKVMASTDSGGLPNAAVFGSPRIMEDGRLLIGLSRNRTSVNLEENGRAVLMAFVPSEEFLAWRGIRVYLELESMETEGPVLERLRENIASQAGRGAARMVVRAAIFRIVSQRPLLDMPAA